MAITYEWIDGAFIDGNEYYEKLLKECSELYSTQYGRWSQAAPYNAGDHIKLSPKKIREWLQADDSAIYWAKDGDQLIGYAIAIQLNLPSYGIISWVTQLVVHEDYRHKDIAKSLLHSIWGFTDNYAWGIVSANPYAVRALEKTTRRRSDPRRIKHNLKKILSIGAEYLPYINETTEAFVNQEVSKINTQFFVDHADVDQMIQDVVTDTVPWTLGPLEEGWEWLAFTFKDQLPFELSEDEIQSILKTSDVVVHNAYKRMDYNASQVWNTHTVEEVDFIIQECGLNSRSRVIDFGCGQGRHALELASRGIEVTGIDYVDKNIGIANKKKEELNVSNIKFIIEDCRSVKLHVAADAAICLYDVIGSYADNEDNKRIIRNIAEHLKPGGVAIISVMNYHLTESQAKNRFILRENPNELLTLKPSNIMETTGNIFDPDYYLIDTETGVVYRREQFRRGRSLPVELIVRDKRFNIEEIKKMCEEAGLEVEFARFVNARSWALELSATDKRAKEILVKCKKSIST